MLPPIVLLVAPPKIPIPTLLGKAAGAGKICADQVVLNLIQLGAGAADADARADVPADDVRRGSGGTTNGVRARAPKDGDAFKLIADRRSSCGIEADNVPLHLVRICARCLLSAIPCCGVAGNHVAPTCACSAADRVVLCALDNRDARGVVRQSRAFPWAFRPM